MSGLTLNKNFQFPDGLYFVLYIKDYLEYIIKKQETVTDNPPIRMYVSKIENRIIFKVKTGYYPKPLLTETMKLLGSSKNKLTKDKNGENVPHLEITEKLLLDHCSIVNSDHQHDSKVFYTFVPNKSFGQLLHISLKRFTFLKSFDSEFSYITVSFTDQSFELLETEDKINII